MSLVLRGVLPVVATIFLVVSSIPRPLSPEVAMATRGAAPLPCTGRLGTWECPAALGGGQGAGSCSNNDYSEPFSVAYHWIHIPVLSGDNCNDHNYWDGGAWVPCPGRADYADDQSEGPCVARWVIF